MVVFVLVIHFGRGFARNEGMRAASGLVDAKLGMVRQLGLSLKVWAVDRLAAV